MTVYLKPVYDKVKSFYNKAQIIFNERNNINKSYTLYSYGVEVMKITKKYIYFMEGANYSITTLRHIRELLRQYGGQYEKYKQYKDSLYNITKRGIINGGYVFNNTLKINYGDTRQTAIKELNK